VLLLLRAVLGLRPIRAGTIPCFPWDSNTLLPVCCGLRLGLNLLLL